MRLAAAGLAVWWLSSNFVVIGNDEQALVTRYGRLRGTLEPGIKNDIGAAGCCAAGVCAGAGFCATATLDHPHTTRTLPATNDATCM